MARFNHKISITIEDRDMQPIGVRLCYVQDDNWRTAMAVAMPTNAYDVDEAVRDALPKLLRDLANEIDRTPVVRFIAPLKLD